MANENLLHLLWHQLILSKLLASPGIETNFYVFDTAVQIIHFNKIELIVTTLVNGVTTNFGRFSIKHIAKFDWCVHFRSLPF